MLDIKTLMPQHLTFELFMLHETLLLKKCPIVDPRTQGRYLADNQQDDSIVVESGAGRFLSHLREQRRLRRVCALALSRLRLNSFL